MKIDRHKSFPGDLAGSSKSPFCLMYCWNNLLPLSLVSQAGFSVPAASGILAHSHLQAGLGCQFKVVLLETNDVNP